MTDNEDLKVTGIYSKFWRITLVVLSMLMIFAGPTYLTYILANVMKIDYFASIGVGFVIFIAGLGLMFFLMRKKLITI